MISTLLPVHLNGHVVHDFVALEMLKRINKLRSQVLGVKEKEKTFEMDVKRYAKYLLEEGSIDEKRQLLEQLRGKLVLKDKRVNAVL